MKKFRILFLFMLLLSGSSFLTSCSEDDTVDELVAENRLIGSWIEQGEDYYVIFNFQKDGTGSIVTHEEDENGNSTDDTLVFVYTYSAEKNLLKINVSGSGVILNYTVNLTGNTLMLSDDDGTFVLTKK